MILLFVLLDRVIATVSGKSYAEFMKVEVLPAPGLTHTSVFVDSILQAHTVRHYDAQSNPVPALDFDHRGASAVYSSARDLIRYGMFHLQNGLPGNLATKLSIRNGRNIVLETDGTKTRPIRVQNPPGGTSFRQGVFQAPFFGLSQPTIVSAPHMCSFCA